MNQDQVDKAVYAVHCIQEQCQKANGTNSNESLQLIARALQRGDRLEAIPLTGGLTNYSYKVRLQHSPEVSVFAKLSFPYALWNPDKTAHYDVQRTRHEFVMMKKFSEIAPSCVPTPYFVEPVEDMMVVATAWCPNDRPLVHQVTDGILDLRVCQQLARSMALLHCQPFDPSFNTGIRTSMISTFATLKSKFEAMLKATHDDSRATAAVKIMGDKHCTCLVNHMQCLYQTSRDCLVHSDLHVRNILVEPHTVNRATTTARFGPKGSFANVDWEMAFAGPIGRDLGTLFPFPLCTAMAHALQGNHTATINVLYSIQFIWDEYSEQLRSLGKDEAFLCHALRSIIGWCGRFMFLGFYTSGVHVEDFPLNDTNDKEILLDAIGVLGINLMNFGFMHEHDTDKLDVDDIHQQFQQFIQIIWEEIATVIAIQAPKQEKQDDILALSRLIVSGSLHGNHVLNNLTGLRCNKNELDRLSMLQQISKCQVAVVGNA